MGTGLAARLLLTAGGGAALVALGLGLVRLVHFERTPAAVRDERTGTLLVLVACLVLLAVAAAATRSSPLWVPIAISTPALLCGGLVLLAGGTLLPQIAALPAFGVALVGLVALLVRLRG